MTAAKTYKSTGPRKRITRAVKTGVAAQAIGNLTPQCELFILTYGQFSLIDSICAILDQTGPADVTLATWTAAHADLDRSEALLKSAQIRSMRFIVDRSFAQRMPHYARAMVDLFGTDSFRAIKSHAKWCVIQNEQWNIVLRTSMNLNHNPRLENLEISDDPNFANFFMTLADEIFREVDPGEFLEQIPPLENFDWTAPTNTATASRIDISRLGRASPGAPKLP